LHKGDVGTIFKSCWMEGFPRRNRFMLDPWGIFFDRYQNYRIPLLLKLLSKDVVPK